jgi:hypothetical protein
LGAPASAGLLQEAAGVRLALSELSATKQVHGWSIAYVHQISSFIFSFALHISLKIKL